MISNSFNPRPLASGLPVSRRGVLGGILGGAAWLTLAACGSSGGGAAGGELGAGLPPKFTPGTEAWEKQYEQLIEAAKKEGELVAMFGSSTVAAEQNIRDEFSKRYGVKFTLVPGSTKEITARVLAERSQGIYSTDIAGMGPSGIEAMMSAKVVTPLEPALIVPDVKDRSKDWRIKYMPWSDADPDGGHVTYYTLSVSSNLARIFYNKDNVSQQEIDSVKSWKDFLDPKWKGRLAITDLVGRAARLRSTLYTVLGRDFWDQLVRSQELAIWEIGSDTNFANAILNGDQDVVLIPGSAEGALLDAIDQGLPIADWPVTLKEGPSLDFDGMIGIMDKAPHPNAAKLYVNWILSKEGGTIFNALNKKVGLHLRSDVPKGALDDATWQRVNSFDYSTVLPPNSPEQRKTNDESQKFWQGLYTELGIALKK